MKVVKQGLTEEQSGTISGTASARDFRDMFPGGDYHINCRSSRGEVIAQVYACGDVWVADSLWGVGIADAPNKHVQLNHYLAQVREQGGD